MSIYTLVLEIAIGLLCIGLVLTLVRFIKGPSLPDRIIALDLLSSILIGVLVIYAIVSGVRPYIDVALVLSLVTFLGTMVFANYLLEENKRKKK